MASDQQMVRIGPIRLFLTGKALDSIDPEPGIQGRLLLDRAGSDATLCRLARAGQHCHVLPVGALGSGPAGSLSHDGVGRTDRGLSNNYPPHTRNNTPREV